MKTEITQIIQNKLNTGELTKMELHVKTGLSRVTIDSRLKLNNWKKIEILALQKLL